MSILYNLMRFCSAAALVAALPIQSSEFYFLVRVVLFIGLLVGVFMVLDYTNDDAVTMVPAVMGLLLWNPFFMPDHDKSVWVVFDLLACALFAYWAFSVKKSIDWDAQIEESQRKVINHDS